jgi:uncharacterized protein (DUF2062 family)
MQVKHVLKLREARRGSKSWAVHGRICHSRVQAAMASPHSHARTCSCTQALEQSHCSMGDEVFMNSLLTVTLYASNLVARVLESLDVRIHSVAPS